MEYTQWAVIYENGARVNTVLILVVMEYTQWVNMNRYIIQQSSLNPCCNGIYSMSHL